MGLLSLSCKAEAFCDRPVNPLISLLHPTTGQVYLFGSEMF